MFAFLFEIHFDSKHASWNIYVTYIGLVTILITALNNKKYRQTLLTEENPTEDWRGGQSLIT